MARLLGVSKFGTGLADQNAITSAGLVLRAIDGREELSRLFAFRLHFDLPEAGVLPDANNSALRRDQILGKEVIFLIEPDEAAPRQMRGIVRDYAFTGKNAENRVTLWADVVPELWTLTEISDARRFAEGSETVGGIVNRLIGELLPTRGFTLDDTITAGADGTEPDRAQDGESYFDFLSRLMAREGIYFYFADAAGEAAQHFILGNAADGFGGIPSDPPAAAAPHRLLYEPTASYTPAAQVVNLELRHSYRPSRWVTSDYNYTARNTSLTRPQADVGLLRKLAAGPGFSTQAQGDGLAGRLDAAETVRGEYLLGASNCKDLFPGALVQIQSCPFVAGDAQYVVTSIRHHAAEKTPGDAADSDYANTFIAVLKDRLPRSCPAAGELPDPRYAVFAAAQASGGMADPADLPPGHGGIPPGRGGTPPGQGRRSAIHRNHAPGEKNGETISPAARPFPLAETAFVCDASGRFKNDTAADPQVKVEGTIHTDATNGYGRVQVIFPWETIDTSAEPNKAPWVAGRWIRVAQLMAGPNWGAKFFPRVGQEVIVLYTGVRGREPLVMGSVYNSAMNHTTAETDRTMASILAAPGPYGSSGEVGFSRDADFGIADISGDDRNEHMLVSGTGTITLPDYSQPDVYGFRTRSNVESTNATAGFNEILFKDTLDEEQIFVHAQQDYNIQVERDMNVEIKGDKREIIRGNYYRIVNLGDSLDDLRDGPAGDGDSRNRRASNRTPYEVGGGRADGGVNRAIVDGVSFEADKVWQWKVVQGDDHKYTVYEENYHDAESRTEGDFKSEHVGEVESYFGGNTYSFFGGTNESTSFGLNISTFVGPKFDFELAIGIGVNLSLLRWDLSAGLKIETNETITLTTNNNHLDDAATKLIVNKLHIQKSGVIDQTALTSFKLTAPEVWISTPLLRINCGGSSITMGPAAIVLDTPLLRRTGGAAMNQFG